MKISKILSDTVLLASLILCGLAVIAEMINAQIEDNRLIRQVETSPDVRTLGKVTDSTPTENNSNKLIRLDDGTTLILDTTDDIPAGVTAVLRRTDKRPGEQQNWLCLKALSTEHTTCYRLKGNLF
ncbi:hypothetical protein NAK90_004189 [Salmonella enterica]|uniref:Uncharacterized protein n=2 Tax=Salmonella enterica TaxID=28901 RepID=A0A764Z1Q2_SALER|nr:hypothetical protein [Salmonella enterica subsp. enterica serovar Java]EBR9314258.1 hypothetical protein [Salmonella enterica subsp. enterica serovar Muenchen]EDQ3993467.1 hypothetical protein [Salmonella enterica subsp. enterica]EDS8889813.1 hypothetical protein [Salmonella enterica]EDX3512362.1 hypothetical protein [Salmonella enterica subsp. enterica serovar Adelaide]EEE5037238.1 hypothetical protein [Salmonella enterica subsp. diarizonae]EHG9470829.1 hypothetical protein [Salmonella en